MPGTVTQTRQFRASRLNWGLILSMVANAVLVVGLVVLIKALLTIGIVRLFGLE